MQLPILLVVAAGYWWLLHQTTMGRGLVAIGYSPEGALYAGIPVERRLTLVYTLAGLMASVAALVYVSHLGQAKADAGTGYELMAITAVVLGGTSILGGRGTVHGTLLGLVAIVVLQNGLRLAALPAELAGILIGGILLATIAVERLAAIGQTQVRGAAVSDDKEFEVKNSQVAVICGVILLAAGIVAWSNITMLRSLIATTAPSNITTGGIGDAPRLTIAMMPKSKGNAYFIACRKGAEEAAKDWGLN